MTDVTLCAVIPNYNKSKFIPRMMESVLQQSDNFDEIIIIDDGSTDNSYDELNSRLSLICQLHHQTNQGVAAARNNGLHRSKSEWIVFLDSDDTLDLEFVSTIKSFIRTNSVAAEVIVTGWNQKDVSGIIIHDQPSVFSSDWLHHTLIHGLAPIHAVVLKTESAIRIGGFNEQLPAMEDTDFFLRLLMSNQTIQSVPKVLCTYFHSPGSRGMQSHNVAVANLVILCKSFVKYCRCWRCIRRLTRFILSNRHSVLRDALKLLI